VDVHVNRSHIYKSTRNPAPVFHKKTPRELTLFKTPREPNGAAQTSLLLYVVRGLQGTERPYIGVMGGAEAKRPLAGAAARKGKEAHRGEPYAWWPLANLSPPALPLSK